MPRPCHRALDVGCGLGDFARRLAAMADEVDAIDLDRTAIAGARARSPGPDNLRFVEADFLTWSAGPYDFVSMIAALHHMPFDEAVSRAAGLLRPGGVLAVIGLHRNRLLLDLVPNAIALPVSWWYRLTRSTAPVGAPIREPTMSLGAIRRGAAAALPGAVVRRRLLWRYSMVWTKPPR